MPPVAHAWVLIPLTVIATALRLFAKVCNPARQPKTISLAADDLFAILASIMFCAFAGLAWWGMWSNREDTCLSCAQGDSRVYVAHKLFHEVDSSTPEALVATTSHFLKVRVFAPSTSIPVSSDRECLAGILGGCSVYAPSNHWGKVERSMPLSPSLLN